MTAPDPVSGSYGSLTITEDGAWTYSLDNSNATVNALGQGATLTDSLTIQAKDGTAGTITITITGANDAATFSGTQSGAVTEDATVNTATGTITVSDVDGDNALKQQADQTGSYGSLSVNHSTGVWTYTLTNSGDNAQARATQALAGGATATETFTILAADDTPTTLTITITGANDAATIGGAVTGAITEGTASTTGTVTSTDVDGTDNAFRTEVSPNDSTTLTTGTGTYGTLTITSAGAWTYTLDNSAGGATDLLAGGAEATDAFTIMAEDGTSGTVTITITGVDDLSTLSGGFEGSVTEDSTTNATATGEITVADIDTTPIPTITAQTTTGTYGSFTIGKKNPSDNADRVYSWTYTLDNTDEDTNALAAGATVMDEFTITTSDGVTKKVTITITGADDSSTIGGDLSGSVTEDDSANLTAEGTATVTDEDSEATFVAQTGTDGSYGTFSITTAGVWSYSLDNSPGDILGNATNALKAGQTESETFLITTSDDNSVNVTITVNGANDAAVFGTTGLTGTISEDEDPNTVTGTAQVTDVDEEDNKFTAVTAPASVSGTYGSLTITEDGAWTYSLDNSNATVDALGQGATLTDSLTIQAKDGTAGTITITITGVNDKSSIDVTGSGGAVTEDDTANATVTGTFTLTDPDTSPLPTITEETRTGTYGQLAIAPKISGTNDGEYTWTYTLTNSGDNDQARATQALAGGATATETFTIAASDNGEAMVTITITGVNDAATFSGPATRSGAVTEDATSNTATGTITVSDVDGDNALKEQADQTGSYGSLSVDHSAGTWTYTLTNSGDNARARATQALADEETATETFTILAADDTETMVTITITGVNDAAVFGTTGLTGSITEDAAPNTVTDTVTSTDVDGEDNKFTAVTAPASVSGTYGSLTITEDGAWTYSLDNSNATVNALGQGATLTDSLTIQAKDGTAGTITITITGANDAATFSGTQTGAVTEDDATSNTATGTITVSDVDGDNALKEQADQTGSYGSLSVNHSTGVWTYTLTNSGDNARARATQALADEETADDTFTILAADDTPTTLTITITGVNDAAVFGTTGLTGSITEDAAPNTVTGTAQATDVDGEDNKFTAVTAPASVSGTYGSLTITEDGAWTYSLDNSNATVNALGQGATLTDSLTIQTADGTAGTITITITGANDAATFSGTQSGAVTEDATVNTATGTITVSDVDGDNALKQQADQTGSYGNLSVNHSTGVWTYTLTNSGDNARARATQALAGGATATETFTILAADDTPTTLTITITGANDAATIGGTVTGAISEGTASTTGTVTSTDVDGTDNAFRTEVSPNDGTTLTTGRGTYGTLTITSAGAWTYTLDNSAGGATDLLAGGATAPDAFTIMAADGTSGTVTITITGVDDLSTLSGGFEGSVTEDSTTNATATGEITVADIDTTPIPTITAQTTTGTYGSFTIGKKTPSDEADRVYSWTYTLDNADDDTNALAAGTIVEDEFTITTSDGVNAKVTITITGADDSSTIGGALSGSVTEDDSDDLTAGGTATVTDRDSEATFVAQTGTDGSYGTFSITAAGVWSYSLDNSPGDNLGNATNALKAGQTESETFPITTSDGSSVNVTITVNGANDAAVFGTTGLTGSITEDAAPNTVTDTATSTDVDGEDNKFTAVTAPASVSGTYGSLTITEDGAWTYSLDNSNATVNALGQDATLADSLTIQAKDGTAGTITITITGVNDKSSIDVTGSGGSVTEDDTANATVTGTFTLTDPDTSPLPTITEETRTGTYGRLAIAPKISGTNDGEYTWTYTLTNSGDNDQARATQALAGGATATETFTIAASDNGEAMVTITITGANDAATFGGTSTGSVTEDATETMATGTITVTDVDGDNTLQAQTVTRTYGDFVVNSNGSWTYTLDNSRAATNALSEGRTVSEGLRVTASDGTSGPSISINVTGANDPATIGGDLEGSVTEDATETMATGTVALSDVDGGSSLTAQTDTPGKYGTFSLNATSGAWTYSLDNSDPDTNALRSGQTVSDETFAIAASDGASATVTISITGADDPTSIGGTLAGAVTEGAAVATAEGTASITSDDSTVTFTAQTDVDGTYGTFSLATTGDWTYSLDDSDTDTNALADGVEVTDSFTIATSDGSTASVVITITGANDPATIGGMLTGAITEDAAPNTTTGTVTSTDVDGDNNVFKTEVSPATGTYGSLTITDAGVWTYTLDNSAGGATDLLAGGATATDVFTIMAADGTSGTVTITITGVDETIGGDLTGYVKGYVKNRTAGTATYTGTNPFNPQSGRRYIYGTFSIDANGEWRYALNSNDPDTRALGQNEQATETITIIATDNTTATITITIAGSGSIRRVLLLTPRDGSLDVNWPAYASAPGGYRVRWRTVTPRGSLTGHDVSAGTLSYTITGLTNGTKYFVRVDPLGVNGAVNTGNTLKGGAIPTATTTIEGDLMVAVTEGDGPVTRAATTRGGATTFKTEVSPNSGRGTYGTLTIKTNGEWTYNLDNGGAVKNLPRGGTETDIFTIMAADDATATITITITAGSGDAATIGGDLTGSVTEDVDPNTATGTAESTDPDGEDNKFIAVTTPASGRYGSLTLTEDGAWTYSLNNGNTTVNELVQGAALADSFTIMAADGTEGTITIIIMGANDPAVFGTMGLTGSVTEDAVKTDLMTPANKITGTATVTDVDGDNNSFKTDVTPTLGTYGSLTITPAGVWTYTLDNEDDDTNALVRGATATDAFTIMAADGTEATVTITITGTNDPAVFGTMGLTGAVTEDAMNAGTPDNEATGTATVTDVDGTDGSFRTDVTPARGRYGSLTITEAGVWTYELDNSDPDTAALRSGQDVTDAFTIRAADWTPATVTITVSGADDPSKIGGNLAGAVTEDDDTNNTASGTVTLTGDDGTTTTITAKTETSAYGMFTLGANGSWTYTLDNDLPATHALADGAVVTDPFTIAASDGSSATVIITITGADDPDLLVASVSGLPMEWKDGTSFTATAVVRNQGKADAGSFEIGLYASLDRTITTGDIRIASASVSTLAKDASSSVSLAVSEGFGTLGLTQGRTYYLGVIADINGDIAEVDEGNNDDHANSTPHSISLIQDLPDLVISSVSGVPARWTDGETFTVSAVVRNQGDGDAGAFEIGLYQPRTLFGAPGRKFILNGRPVGIPIGKASVSALAKDMSTTVNIEVSGRFSVLGIEQERTAGLGFLADIGNQVAESDESNNGKLSNMVFSLNDNAPTPPKQVNLVIQSVSGLPAQWRDGERPTVSVRVRNAGRLSTIIGDEDNKYVSGAFTVGLYISTDAIITTEDIPIADYRFLFGMEADDIVPVEMTVYGLFEDLGLTAGTYYLGVIPDINNEVAESNELDNNLHANQNLAQVLLVDSDETITIDNNYSGRWGWRGKGVTGPRGVEVAPWKPAAPVSTFETDESNRLGWRTSTTTSRDWSKPSDGNYYSDPIGAIGARDAYAMGLDGSGVVVAVVDQHIDNRHVDLDGNFLKHYDASGVGVVANNTYNNHGTHVAGIIAAEADGEGMHGVAPGAHLIGISFGGSEGGSQIIEPEDLITSIRSAVKDGARIFNNSWGTAKNGRGSLSPITSNRQMWEDILSAIDQGAVFVWSAGNRYSQNTDLGDDNTSEEAKAGFYNSDLKEAGGFVNVVALRYNSDNSAWERRSSSQICGVTKDFCLSAPGTLITSTEVGNNYNARSGTSMAAPMVSGGLAILFQAFPYVETADIMQLLFETATDLGDKGVDSIYGHGMMNLAAALNPVGSASIPTTTSTATGAGIDVQASALLAEAPLRTAVAAATADMVMLDDYDRAFVIGDVMDDLAISDIQPLSIASADAVFASVDAELASLRDFGSPITQAAAKAGALTIIGDRLALPSRSGTSEVVLNSIATEDSGLAEFRYVATRAEEGWKASQSLGVIVEEDQLFGNKGSGAYALASQATTLSLGSSGQRDISKGVTLFGGLGLSRTEVSAADQSLVSLSSQFTSASGVVGLRMRDLGTEDRGEFAIQLGQDRAILSGEGSISVPVGREEGGVILFDEVAFDSAALGLEPEVMMSYANEYAPDASYSLSAAGRGEETILSAQWQRTF